MADEHEDVLELEPQDEQHEEAEGQAEPEGEDEFSIELEGEEQADETPLVKQLRQDLRDAQREVSGYRKASAPKPVDVGPEPQWGDYGEEWEYDGKRFSDARSEWLDRKRAAENADADAAREVEVRNQAWQRTLSGHRAKAAALPVKDYDAAEQTVVSALPEVLQSALVAYSKDSAKVVYALSKHPAKLAQLAQESDPIRFVQQVNEIERNLKVTTRRKPPEPEASTIQRGSAPVSSPNTTKELEKLEKEAERTGDRTRIIAYKRAQRETKK